MTYISAFFVLFATLNIHAAENEPESYNVVELFTSQGCSSCPPADKYLGELAKDESTITIACHVTYWDYLGWKDTFSQQYCDSRQIFYKKRLKLSTAYTPQMIINGKFQGVGSQRYRMQKLFSQANAEKPLAKISIQKESDKLSLNFNSLKQQNDTEILLFGIGDTYNVPIKNGENGGRNLQYHSPLGVKLPLGEYTKENTLLKNSVVEKNIAKYSHVNTWVALVQDSITGKLIAAGQYKNK